MEFHPYCGKDFLGEVERKPDDALEPSNRSDLRNPKNSIKNPIKTSTQLMPKLNTLFRLIAAFKVHHFL